MSNIFDNISGLNNNKKHICHVAYTINNKQPVMCSIIGDQPLFYMDYNIDYEDEESAFFDNTEIKILENEIENLEKELKFFDVFSKSFSETPKDNFLKLLDNKNIITKSKNKNVFVNNKQLIKILSKSRIAKTYLSFAQEHNVEIKLSSQIYDAQYDRKSSTIFINSNLNLVDQILLTARELRRHWQHRQGALINPLMFHPDNTILINRAQIADLTVSMIRIAWELQLSGEKDVWKRIENSSMADLGHVFAKEAFFDFRTLNNGHAATAVFENWFLSERCHYEDKKIIQQMLSDYNGYVFNNQKIQQTITPTLIAALGSMPYGKNYLTQHISTIINDPIFTDVRDRSSANFLWFIKFECSFRETEQELQNHIDLSTEDINFSNINTIDQDIQHDTKKTRNVISLFPDAKNTTEKTKKESGSSKILSSKSKENQNKTTLTSFIFVDNQQNNAIKFTNEYADMKSPQIQHNIHQEILNWCIAVLSKSPTARPLIKTAIQYNWQITVDNLNDLDFYLDISNKIIILNKSDLDTNYYSESHNILYISLIHALRDVWQEIHHNNFNEKYNIESILKLEQVRSADCHAVAILIAWELRNEGQLKLWHYIIDSQDGDIAIAFSDHLKVIPSDQFNGKALITAFKQWYFDKTRISACNHNTLEYMDNVIHKYPIGNPFGTKKLTYTDIENLSYMPDKMIYLCNMGEEILNNLLYNGLYDKINQSHFKQILHDIKVTYVENVPFTDINLAKKIFPNGKFTQKVKNLHEIL